MARPVHACSPPGDGARLFVVEQWTGLIRILVEGEFRPTPFLDLHSQITVGDDQGMRAMAFHPDYAASGSFFVSYIDLAGDLVLSRFHVSTDPDVADPASEEIVLVIDEPGNNHSGGMIAFGPKDGYLYFATGDGGPGNDPGNHAQDPSQLLGKILRLDVDSAVPYGIPPDNPFVGSGDPRDEIWAMGLRHPWRFTFDRLTGDLYLGDVGQGQREELDFQPGTSTGGENYGWRCFEGTRCTGLSGCLCSDLTLKMPIYEYDHTVGCSVICGYVYRGCAVPDLQGTFFFTDYCNERIQSFRYDGAVITDFQDRTGELAPTDGSTIQSPHAFAEDAFGELYILDGAQSKIWKIVPREPVARWSTYGTGWPGTFGIPTLASQHPPKPCSRIGLMVENSRGAPTIAFVLAGVSDSSAPSSWGGTFLVDPILIRQSTLITRRGLIPFLIPCDVSLCQVIAYIQVVEVDPGASKGLSFTQGLKLTIGDS